LKDQRRGRVLVTGGAGFVGSHLCELLLARGFQVICLDNLLTGREVNVRHLMDREGFTFVRHDITRPIDLNDDGPPISHVAHLASPASPVHYVRFSIETLNVGSVGTYNALEVARQAGASFLLASTSEVYGDPQVNPQPETYWGHVNSIGPRSMYDESKRFAEAMTMAFARVHSLDVRIARIFNTYGPRMPIDDGRVIPSFFTHALRGQPLPIFGDGGQTRSFCYVDDLVEGLFRLLFVERTALAKSSASLPVVNLGNPEEMTVAALATEILALTGSNGGRTFKPLPGDDPKVRCPDISRARAVLGWEPTVSRREGLQLTLPWFREAVEAADHSRSRQAR